jgi:hypothetical protein
VTGTLHYEGQEYLGSAALKNTGQATLYIGLYTNLSAPTVDNTMENITEVNGGGYARLPLNASDWNINVTKTANQGTIFEQPIQRWTFTTIIGNITGYFITTEALGTTGKLLLSEQFPAPANVNQSDFELDITPKQEVR